MRRARPGFRARNECRPFRPSRVPRPFRRRTPGGLPEYFGPTFEIATHYRRASRRGPSGPRHAPSVGVKKVTVRLRGNEQWIRRLGRIRGRQRRCWRWGTWEWRLIGRTIRRLGRFGRLRRLWRLGRRRRFRGRVDDGWQEPIDHRRDGLILGRRAGCKRPAKSDGNQRHDGQMTRMHTASPEDGLNPTH